MLGEPSDVGLLPVLWFDCEVVPLSESLVPKVPLDDPIAVVPADAEILGPVGMPDSVDEEILGPVGTLGPVDAETLGPEDAVTLGPGPVDLELLGALEDKSPVLDIPDVLSGLPLERELLVEEAVLEVWGSVEIVFDASDAIELEVTWEDETGTYGVELDRSETKLETET